MHRNSSRRLLITIGLLLSILLLGVAAYNYHRASHDTTLALDGELGGTPAPDPTGLDPAGNRHNTDTQGAGDEHQGDRRSSDATQANDSTLAPDGEQDGTPAPDPTGLDPAGNRHNTDTEGAGDEDKGDRRSSDATQDTIELKLLGRQGRADLPALPRLDPAGNNDDAGAKGAGNQYPRDTRDDDATQDAIELNLLGGQGGADVPALPRLAPADNPAPIDSAGLQSNPSGTQPAASSTYTTMQQLIAKVGMPTPVQYLLDAYKRSGVHGFLDSLLPDVFGEVASSLLAIVDAAAEEVSASINPQLAEIAEDIREIMQICAEAKDLILPLIAPNSIWRACLLEDTATIEKLVAKNPSILFATNSIGQAPLGFSLRLLRTRAAETLLHYVQKHADEIDLVQLLTQQHMFPEGNAIASAFLAEEFLKALSLGLDESSQGPTWQKAKSLLRDPSKVQELSVADQEEWKTAKYLVKILVLIEDYIDAGQRYQQSHDVVCLLLDIIKQHLSADQRCTLLTECDAWGENMVTWTLDRLIEASPTSSEYNILAQQYLAKFINDSLTPDMLRTYLAEGNADGYALLGWALHQQAALEQLPAWSQTSVGKLLQDILAELPTDKLYALLHEQDDRYTNLAYIAQLDPARYDEAAPLLKAMRDQLTPAQIADLLQQRRDDSYNVLALACRSHQVDAAGKNPIVDALCQLAIDKLTPAQRWTLLTQRDAQGKHMVTWTLDRLINYSSTSSQYILAQQYLAKFINDSLTPDMLRTCLAEGNADGYALLGWALHQQAALEQLPAWSETSVGKLLQEILAELPTDKLYALLHGQEDDRYTNLAYIAQLDPARYDGAAPLLEAMRDRLTPAQIADLLQPRRDNSYNVLVLACRRPKVDAAGKNPIMEVLCQLAADKLTPAQRWTLLTRRDAQGEHMVIWTLDRLITYSSAFSTHILAQRYLAKFINDSLTPDMLRTCLAEGNADGYALLGWALHQQAALKKLPAWSETSVGKLLQEILAGLPPDKLYALLHGQEDRYTNLAYIAQLDPARYDGAAPLLKAMRDQLTPAQIADLLQQRRDNSYNVLVLACRRQLADAAGKNPIMEVLCQLVTDKLTPDQRWTLLTRRNAWGENMVTWTLDRLINYSSTFSTNILAQRYLAKLIHNSLTPDILRTCLAEGNADGYALLGWALHQQAALEQLPAWSQTSVGELLREIVAELPADKLYALLHGQEDRYTNLAYIAQLDPARYDEAAPLLDAMRDRLTPAQIADLLQQRDKRGYNVLALACRSQQGDAAGKNPIVDALCQLVADKLTPAQRWTLLTQRDAHGEHIVTWTLERLIEAWPTSSDYILAQQYLAKLINDSLTPDILRICLTQPDADGYALLGWALHQQAALEQLPAWSQTSVCELLREIVEGLSADELCALLHTESKFAYSNFEYIAVLDRALYRSVMPLLKVMQDKLSPAQIGRLLCHRPGSRRYNALQLALQYARPDAAGQDPITDTLCALAVDNLTPEELYTLLMHKNALRRTAFTHLAKHSDDALCKLIELMRSLDKDKLLEVVTARDKQGKLHWDTVMSRSQVADALLAVVEERLGKDTAAYQTLVSCIPSV